MLNGDIINRQNIPVTHYVACPFTELAQREAEASYLHAEAQYRMNNASFSTFHSTAVS